MNSDIERLCRAAKEADKKHDATLDAFVRGDYEILVRAILSELRKPSERMKSAGVDVGLSYYSEELLENMSDRVPEEIWQAMLDSITEEDDEQG